MIPDTNVVTTGNANLFAFTRMAVAALRMSRPDVIHGITTASIIPMIVYRLCFNWRVRLVFEMHGWAWFEQAQSRRPFLRIALAILDYLGLWFTDAVIAVSKTERSFLARLTFGASRIHVVWDPVDFDDEYSPADSGGEIVVGYIGNSAWWQGLQHLTAAAAQLAGENIRFRLAGFDAADATRFPVLPNVEYIGRVERKDVVSFLRGCDILVSPRLPEKVSNLQFPHKLSEYLAVGRPVVVSSASDQPEVVREGKCGIVAEPLSGESVAQAIREIAALAPSEREQWGRRAYEYAHTHLHARVFGERLAKVYDAVLTH